MPSAADSGRLRWVAETLLDLGEIGADLELDDRTPFGLEFESGPRVEIPLLERAFHELSLEREMVSGQVDRHRRFNEASAEWDLNDPWLSREARRLAELAATSSPPSLEVVVTHDVDWVTALEPASLAKAAAGRFARGSSPWISLRDSLRPGLLVRSFESLLQAEQEQGIRPLVFMLSGPWGLGRYSTRYRIDWPAAREIVSAVHEAGGEVGLHASYSARERRSYGVEAGRIERITGRPVRSHRNHYLRFDPRSIWSELEKAGLTLDTSLGFAGRTGFRVPVASSFFPWDWMNEKKSTVQAVPMVWMERPRHLFDPRSALDRLTAILRVAQVNGGRVSLLFHPEACVIDPRWRDLWMRVLELCSEIGASWFPARDAAPPRGSAGKRGVARSDPGDREPGPTRPEVD